MIYLHYTKDCDHLTGRFPADCLQVRVATVSACQRPERERERESERERERERCMIYLHYAKDCDHLTGRFPADCLQVRVATVSACQCPERERERERESEREGERERALYDLPALHQGLRPPYWPVSC